MRDVFLKAAKLVERGWSQHTYYSNGCYCLHGAVNEAESGERTMHGAASYLLLSAGYDIEWNDEYDRDQREVVAVLLEFAEACK